MSNELVKYDFEVGEVGEFAQLVEDELDGVEIRLDRVKIPAGGGTAWEIPTDDPDNPDVAKEIVGVIVDHHKASRLFFDRFEDRTEGESRRPDAWSVDGKTQIVPEETIRKAQERGIPVPHTDLATCPYNKFGSAAELLGQSGKGKANREFREVYVLREGSPLPIQISIPSTSMKNFDNWLSNVVTKQQRRASGVIAKLVLKKTESAGGITYSQVHLTTVDKLDPEKAAAIRNYGEGLKSITRRDPFASLGATSYDAEVVIEASPANETEVVSEVVQDELADITI